ncbi:hypothetical protein EJ110_NYTH58837 [Nymphaea thermarum]|nr:hypothetical protein EJ110_NYTH58837 [Nymphaea thermarum]
MAALAFVAIAHQGHEHWRHVPDVEKNEKVQHLGMFAVKRYNEQNHGKLMFVQVVEAMVLDRGTEHYTYRMVLKVHTGHGIKLYKAEVFDDLSAPCQPSQQIEHFVVDENEEENGRINEFALSYYRTGPIGFRYTMSLRHLSTKYSFVAEGYYRYPHHPTLHESFPFSKCVHCATSFLNTHPHVDHKTLGPVALTMAKDLLRVRFRLSRSRFSSGSD